PALFGSERLRPRPGGWVVLPVGAEAAPARGRRGSGRGPRHADCTGRAGLRTTGGTMTDARRRPLRRTRRGSVAAVLALSAALATAPALAAGPQPLEEIAAAAVSAVGAEDAQAAEAVLAPSLRLARCRQPLQAVATGPRTA